MGCKPSRAEKGAASDAYAAAGGVAESVSAAPELPEDDYVPHITGLASSDFAVAGGEGWLYLYDGQTMRQLSKFRAHKKAVNRLLEGPAGSLLTASADGTVRLWNQDGLKEGSPKPVQQFEGHIMSVSALDIVEEWGSAGEMQAGTALFTGSRDCSVMLWDLETGRSVQKNKILRNVVTAIRRVPQPGGAAGAAVQASEDLQLRLWDTRQGILKGPAAAVRAGPNQLICLDVSPDGNYVACGSKGFSRENCEVKVFDLRASLQELHSLPCADQTIEALRHVGSDCCLTASKDGHVRAVSLPSPKVVLERRSTKIGAAGYTALGVSETGAALCAWVGPEGVGLELLAWKDLRLDQQPAVLATT